MFTHQFFDLLLNLDDNSRVKEVEANHKTSEINGLAIRIMTLKSQQCRKFTLLRYLKLSY